MSAHICPRPRAHEALCTPLESRTSQLRGGGMHRVWLDQYAGARLAVGHLIELGRREIRHVSGPTNAMDAAERVRGWSAVLGEHGLPAREPLVGDWSPGSGYMHGRALAHDAEMTAVFVSNDQMAIGVMHALAEAGHSVPGDVSVVGFDDIPDAAPLGRPGSGRGLGCGRSLAARVSCSRAGADRSDGYAALSGGVVLGRIGGFVDL